MNTMDISVDAFEMHEPMGPIEIEVVKYHCYREADEQVKQAVLANIVVNVCIACLDRQVNTKPDQRKYYHCAHRICKLSYQVFALRKHFLNEQVSPVIFSDHPEYQKCDACGN
jgi:hypothetical protein